MCVCMCEVNSVTGKKSVIFKGGEGGRELNLSSVWRARGPKQRLELTRHLNLFDLNLLDVFFLTKKKEDFGQDMMNAWAYPAFDSFDLNLSGLDCTCPKL